MMLHGFPAGIDKTSNGLLVAQDLCCGVAAD
jgi:hypothetical protein